MQSAWVHEARQRLMDLNDQALEIARKHLLEGINLRDLAKLYHASPSTLHRRLKGWLGESRFELRDRSGNGGASILGLDDDLAEALVRKTGIWRARVVRIAGVEPALGELPSADSISPETHEAYQASDELHRGLGQVAGELLLNTLRRNMTIGLSSGRGVGFTVDRVGELLANAPSWGRGFEGIDLVALCGGAHMGLWDLPYVRDFDADQNVFTLSGLLNVRRSHVHYVTGPVAPSDIESRPAPDVKLSLDLAVIGLGQLSPHHPYLRDCSELQLKTMSEPVRRMLQWQATNKDSLECILEIVLKLYPVSREPLPTEFLEAIRHTNDSILTVPAEKIKNAGEVLLVAGGRQKLEAISGLLLGRSQDTPIQKTNLTLITDAWTAKRICEAK